MLRRENNQFNFEAEDPFHVEKIKIVVFTIWLPKSGLKIEESHCDVITISSFNKQGNQIIAVFATF